MPSDPFIAEIYMFAGNFAPRGYAFCQGQIMSIAQNTALFSLLGTTYGGNGQTTFGLPDLRGRAPVGTGQGPGLAGIILGELAGAPSTTLAVTNMPAHTHAVTGTASQPSSSAAGNADSPNGGIPAGSATDENYTAAASANGALAPAPITATAGPAGGSQPFNNMQPYLGINFTIALQGIFPSRN